MNSFIIIIGVIILIIVLYFIWKSSSGQKPQNNVDPQEDLRIEKVGKGAAISLAGIGPNLEDVDVIVEKRHKYIEDEEEWYELECMAGGKKYHLELPNVGQEEVTITYDQITLQEVKLTKSELTKIDDQEQGTVTHNNMVYHYKDSGSAVFMQDSLEQQAEEFYYWDFASEDNKYFLNVERWGDDSYDISLAETISIGQVTIFSLGNKA